MLRISGPSIDAGIVTRDVARMLAFYRDLLGLEPDSVLALPGGGSMHRLRCGQSLVKILELEPPPEQSAPPGGIRAASGLRYLTIHVSGLARATREIAANGHAIVVDCKTLRKGVAISIVEDPDGNWLELVEYS